MIMLNYSLSLLRELSSNPDFVAGRMRVEAEEAMDALRNELASVKGANARLEEERVKLMEVSKRLRAGRFNYNRNLYFMLSCD